MAEYIEKEALLQAYYKIRPELGTRVIEWTDILENFPTTDVQPVKRGKWKQVSTQVDEYNNHLYECTACRATDRHNINVNVPYCWHCGAKMEE